MMRSYIKESGMAVFVIFSLDGSAHPFMVMLM